MHHNSIGEKVELVEENEKFTLGVRYHNLCVYAKPNEYYCSGSKKIWVGYLSHKDQRIPFIDVSKRSADICEFEIDGEYYSGIYIQFDADGDCNIGEDDTVGTTHGQIRTIVNKEFVTKVLLDMQEKITWILNKPLKSSS